MIAPARPLAEMTEKDWSAQVAELARTLSWLRYHTYRSSRSEGGWPDEALVRDRLVLAELKREGARPSAPQKVWLDDLAAAGCEVYLWTPADLPEVARILGKRWRWSAYNRSLQADGHGWTPSTLWITSRDSQEAA